MSTKLHEAVHRTANKLLDTPEYRKLSFHTTPLEERLLHVLEALGYSEFRDPYKNSAHYVIHPLAYKYFKRYGEQYVQLLEATERLTR